MSEIDEGSWLENDPVNIDIEHPDVPDVPDDASTDSTPAQRRQRPFWVELPILIILAFTLALFLKQFVVQAFFIPSESMLPTLQVHDRLLVDKLVYQVRDPRRGEIVVFVAEAGAHQSFIRRVRSVLLEGFGVQRPGDVDFVKRVIALPGETVELVDGTVFVTPAGGERTALDEPYLAFKDQDNFGPLTVPEDEYFLLGDNRGASSDSRVRGTIPRDALVGRARLRIWPLDRLSRFPNPSYDLLEG